MKVENAWFCQIVQRNEAQINIFVLQ